jgi:hypothetical protein
LPHIRIVDESRASGTVAEDYAFLSASYSALLGDGTPTPRVYRTNSIVPAYFRFGAMQNRVLTNDGRHDGESGPVPSILTMFAISYYSSCFY